MTTIKEIDKEVCEILAHYKYNEPIGETTEQIAEKIIQIIKKEDLEIIEDIKKIYDNEDYDEVDRDGLVYTALIKAIKLIEGKQEGGE